MNNFVGILKHMRFTRPDHLPLGPKLLLAAFLAFVMSGLYAQLPIITHSISDLDNLMRIKPDSAFNRLKDRLQQARRDNDRISEAICKQQMGELLYHQGSFHQAVELVLDAEKVFRNEGQKAWLAQNLNLLGTIYYYNQQPSLAFQQHVEALTLYHTMKNHGGMARTYGYIGHIYEKELRYDSAYYFQRLALDQYRQTDDQEGMAKIYENIGSILEDREAYDSALFYFNTALRLNQAVNNRIAQIEIINNIGDIFRKTGDYRRGLAYTRQAVQMAFATNEKYQLNSAYRDVAKCFHLLGQDDSAYHYMELSRNLFQEIYTEDNNKQITLLQALYDTERKSNEIQRLHAEKRWNILLIGGIVLVLALLGLLAMLVINRQKLKIRNERMTNENNQRLFETQKGLIEAELRNKYLEEAHLKQQLELRSKELSGHILHLIEKNEVMEELRKGLTDIIRDDKRDQKKQLRSLVQKINGSFHQDAYWEEFRQIFDQVHQSFFSKLREQAPDLTGADLRLLALIKMNISSADMSKLLNVSPDSLRVFRYRVKKKLQLGAEASLTDFVHQV